MVIQEVTPKVKKRQKKNWKNNYQKLQSLSNLAVPDCTMIEKNTQ